MSSVDIIAVIIASLSRRGRNVTRVTVQCARVCSVPTSEIWLRYCLSDVQLTQPQLARLTIVPPHPTHDL